MRGIIVRALLGSGIVDLLRRMRQRRSVTILVYHEVGPEVLRRHLGALGKHYRFLPLREYVRARECGDISSLPEYSLVITLDDGHRSNQELVEVFREFGVTPTIFLTSGVIGTRRHFWWKHCADASVCAQLKLASNEERLTALRRNGYSVDAEYSEAQALDDTAIRNMAPNVDFQSHTVNHPVLTTCEPYEARAEIAGSKQDLESRFGLDVYAFAYPNGSYGEREVTAVREAGYRCALTVDNGFNDARSDLYRLKRICIGDADDVGKMLLKACGLWQSMKDLTRRNGRAG